jgi:hypothetical protein
MRVFMLALLVTGCLEPGPTSSPTPTSHYHVIKSSQQ